MTQTLSEIGGAKKTQKDNILQIWINFDPEGILTWFFFIKKLYSNAEHDAAIQYSWKMNSGEKWMVEVISDL